MIPEEDRKQRQLAVRITEREFRDLESISEEKNLPISYFIRKGIGMVIEEHKK